MTIIAATILGLLAVIILLSIARLILWQRRSAEQSGSMHEIEDRLGKLEAILRDIRMQQQELCRTIEEKKFAAPEEEYEFGEASERENRRIGQDEPAVWNEEDGQVPEMRTEQMAEVTAVQAQDNGMSMKNANSDRRGEALASSYNVGKSGKKYTEEELELLIKE